MTKKLENYLTDAEIAALKAQQPRVDAVVKGMSVGWGDDAAMKKPASCKLVLRLLAGMIVNLQDGPLKRIAELEAKVAALEGHGVKYAGTWQRAVPYRRGTVTTAEGGMWIALRDTAEGEAPGKALDAWQLAEKTRRRVPAKRGEQR